MKKYLFFALAAVGLLASCNKNKVEAGPELPFNDDATPVPIQLATSTTTVEVKTKAMVTGEAFTEGSEVYVYAQVRDNQYETSATVGDLISDETEGEELNGILATTDANGAISLGQYYTDKVIYDFYGYYLGGAVAGDIITAGTIPVTIDGTQDIMAAKADPATDLTATGVADEIKNRPALVYSAWSARRNVVPSLKFNHMLTALTVNVKLGTGGDPNINVSQVAVTAPNAGTLTVIPGEGASQAAVGTPDTAETPNAFALTNASAENVLDATEQAVGTLMLFPSTEEIPLTVHFTQGEAATPQTSTVSIPVPTEGDNTGFLAGTHYTVDVIVYGNAPIDITTSITPWTPKELDDINPDELPPL